MLLTVDELVTLVRSSVNVQVPAEDSEGNVITVTDPSYLVMTDDDIKLFIKLGVTRAYPEVEDLSELPDGCEFALVLLTKIELYAKLAVLVAPKVDLGADNNNYIKLDQRFKHYMDLSSSAKDQYNDWLEKEALGANQMTCHDVLLSNRHYTQRNYEKQVTPLLSVIVDEVTSESILFHWKLKSYSHFSRYKVYINTSPVVDMFADGALYKDKITEGSLCVKSTGNIRDTYHELTGLQASTTYYIAVFSIERNQVFGVKEVSFTTLEETDEENESITDLGGDADG